MPLTQIQEAAQAGDHWAQLNLGAAWDNGLLGLPVNAGKAAYWYGQAAQAGIAEAQFNLAHLMVTHAEIAGGAEQARIWFHKAAEQNLPDAQFLLGIMLAEGAGGAVEVDKAVYWLQLAASAGQQDAADYLQKHFNHTR
ncbi:MAG: sel1 repeat family protein [gamma proteobacterium symbiont of Bathyaustriella thionipta]|nr:sel1 repeat family protein [gamma proteobacterium symbiont of Bathyaustriella thionipta]